MNNHQPTYGGRQGEEGRVWEAERGRQGEGGRVSQATGVVWTRTVMQKFDSEVDHG